MKVCPICRKTTLEGQQIICPKCKSESPYTLLEGYSTVKKISDELKKTDTYKKQVKQFRRYLYVAAGLLVLSLVYAFILAPLFSGNKEPGEVIVKAVENPINLRLKAQVDSLEANIAAHLVSLEQINTRVTKKDMENSVDDEQMIMNLEKQNEKMNKGIVALSKSNQEYKDEIHDLQQETERLQTEVNKAQAVQKEKSQEPAASASTTHIVKAGENLYTISKLYYGNGMRYDQIAADNNIADPASIVKGQKLLIKK